MSSFFFMQDERNNQIGVKIRGNSVIFFFSLLSAVSALQLLKLCAGKVCFNSRRVITRKIRDPDGRKMI